jgi:hypothetical protein
MRVHIDKTRLDENGNVIAFVLLSLLIVAAFTI